MAEISPIDELLAFWVYRMQTQGSALLWRRIRLAGHDITPEQFGVLARLKEQEGINQSQLGEKMFKDRHNLTRILNLLEKRGCIERRPDSADKRIFRIFLTQNGRDLQERLTPIVSRHLDQLLHGLTFEELTSMRRILERIVRNIERGVDHETACHPHGEKAL
jgi:DNA-binding MarR family transcriptional regulator